LTDLCLASFNRIKVPFESCNLGELRLQSGGYRKSGEIGIAQSATQGAITAGQLDARPLMRTSEVLETVPA
jgi:hypothetical protein